MTLAVLSVGTAVPEHVMDQDAALAMALEVIASDQRQRRLMRALFHHAGVRTRHTCVPHHLAYRWLGPAPVPSAHPGPTTRERMELYAAHAGPLAVQASGAALAEAHVRAGQITHVVTVSCTGFSAPGVDVALIRQLGLNPTVQRLHIGYMGCQGAINGLRAACGLCAAEPDAFILVCAVELCSLHYRFQWDEERIVGNALFADGAAALVGACDRGDKAALCRVTSTGSGLLPDAEDAMSWEVGDHGFDMYLSPRVPELIREHLRPWLETWLGANDLSVASIRSWAVHPGGPRVLDAVEQALELAPDQLQVSRQILRDCGNMSSPTVLFILKRMLAQGCQRPIVALGFGPGLFVEAARLD